MRYTQIYFPILNLNLYLSQRKIFRIVVAEKEHIFLRHYTILYKFYELRDELKEEYAFELLQNPDFRELRSAEHENFVNFDEAEISPLACHRAWFSMRVLLIAY